MLDIHQLAKHGEYDRLVELLDRSTAEINSTSTAMGEPPLIFASRGGHLSTVRLLLERGADPTIVVSDGDTALHVAIGKIEDGKQPIENFYTIVELFLRYEKEKDDQEGLKLLNLPVSTTDDRTLFNSLRRYPEIKSRILQMVKDIDPSHPLLLSVKASAKPATAITAPARDDVAKPDAQEHQPQSEFRQRLTATKIDGQPQSVEMTARTSNKRPRTGPKPPSSRDQSIVSSILSALPSLPAFFKGYRQVPTNTPSESQKPTSTPR